MPNITKIQYGKPSQVYGVGRHCAFPGCTAILSRYNPDDICASHVLKYHPKESCYASKKEKAQKVDKVTVKLIKGSKIVCSMCGVEKPATKNYFHAKGDGLRHQCKLCANKSRERRNKKDVGTKRVEQMLSPARSY